MIKYIEIFVGVCEEAFFKYEVREILCRISSKGKGVQYAKNYAECVSQN